MAGSPEVCVKADDIKHVLRDGLAFLPGCRDREGRALIVFRPRETPANPDHIRNVLLYLHTVSSESDRGYIVIIDMRGKCKWDCVKPILKTINNLLDRSSVHIVLIIRPDSFWQKQKANIAHTTSRVEVEMVSIDGLTSYFDVSQLPREFGGNVQFDQEMWIDIRLELEKWIWHVSEVMKQLEETRRKVDGPTPTCVVSAEQAITKHNQLQRIILSVPIDRLDNDSNQIREKIDRAKNVDLDAALPHMANLITSLQQLKSEVFAKWEGRREELRAIHQSKLFEQDADGVGGVYGENGQQLLRWIYDKCEEIERQMNDVALNEDECTRQLARLEEMKHSIKSVEVNVAAVCASSARLRGGGRATSRIDEEYSRLHSLFDARHTLLSSAILFYRAEREYSSRLPSWMDHPCISPHAPAPDGRTFETFWDQVYDCYANALDKGSKFGQAWKNVDGGEQERMVKEHMNTLSNKHKHIESLFKEKKMKMTMRTAYNAFEGDLKRVFDWLDEHGESYLRKNTSIGEHAEQTKVLRKHHAHFKEIANNTYENARKLEEASEDIKKSGVCDTSEMNRMVDELKTRIEQFKQKVETRERLLNMTALFYTHFNEILKWYDEMAGKYANMTVEADVALCEDELGQWILESDGTAQAYMTTMAEGENVVRSLEQQRHVDYSTAIERINRMLGQVATRNMEVVNVLNRRRPFLNASSKLANFLHDMDRILTEIQNWKDDMSSLLRKDSFVDTAFKVLPFHEENKHKVQQAIHEIRDQGKEIMQVIESVDPTMCMRDGEPVLEVIRGRCEQLQTAERLVMKCAVECTRRLEAAIRVLQFRDISQGLIRACEQCEASISARPMLPLDLPDANRLTQELADCQKQFEKNEEKQTLRFREELNVVLKHSVDRNLVVSINENVNRSFHRLNLFFNDRNRTIKAGADFYKTYSHVVPILSHLQNEYEQNDAGEWCPSDPKMSAEEKREHIAALLVAHKEMREKLLKGCSLAQKTSELFLKYIERCATSPAKRDAYAHVQQLRAQMREHLATILDLWAKKKRHLDHCHAYQLLDESRSQLVEWLHNEGAKGLDALKANANSNEVAIFRLSVKEHRAGVVSMLTEGEAMANEGGIHAQHVRRVIQLMRDQYSQFTRLISEADASTNANDLALVPSTEIPRRINERLTEPMRELVATERLYIEDLQRCVQVYMKAFDEAEADGSIPATLKGRKAEIFGNIGRLYSFHSETFLSQILRFNDNPEDVGYVFTVYVDMLNELYTEYIVHKDENKLIEDKQTVAFFQSIQEKHNLESNKNCISSLLIKPVQRITRYTLLLQQLNKHTDDNNALIKDAMEVVQGIPKRTNDIIHLNMLDTRDKEKLALCGPFVMQDTLTVYEPRTIIKGRGKERQVFLFECAIAFAKKEEDSRKKIRYILKGKPISLSEVTVVEHIENDPCKFALRHGPITTNDNRTELRANSEVVRIAWIKKLRDLILRGQELVSLRVHLGQLDKRDAASDGGDSASSQRHSIHSTTSSLEQSEEPEEDRRTIDDNTSSDAVPDRPALSTSTGRRKSLRRIFSSKRGEHSPVLSGSALEEAEGVVTVEELPPPMEEIATEATSPPEEEQPREDETSPEDVARNKRKYVLMELVDTEKDYVKDLASVVEGYMNGMNLPEDLVGKDKIIFANIAQIQEFHETCFLREIERCLENYEAAGMAFVKYERRLHTLYVKYCQNKPKSDFLVSQDSFEQYFAETKARLGHKVSLCDLLIKPVQRIMKYQLLLKDVLKFTERAKESTDVLNKALQVMHIVPKACDDMMQVGRLQNFEGSLSAQGKLIHQGTVSLSESGRMDKGKDRRIFLFEQSAIIADCIMPKKDFGYPNYIFKNQIMVNKMILDAQVADDPLKFSIRSSDPNQPTTFIAQCTNEEEKEQWVTKISQQLDQQKTLLAALVDPKRYQNQLAGMASVSLSDEEKKKSGGAMFGRFGSSKSSPSSSSSPNKPTSPKQSSKTKLFNFGKKTKSPTSPPVVGKLK